MTSVASRISKLGRKLLQSWIPLVGAVLGIASLWVAIWTLQITQHSLELASEPTISLTVKGEEDGALYFASSTIQFNLKNTSLTKYEDVLISISIFQTYYDLRTGRLLVGPVAQFLNENNSNFRSYGSGGVFALNDKNESISLHPFEERTFELDLSGFLADGTCPIETTGTAYHDKFKYFIRVDIRYSREIDNASQEHDRYYAIDESGFLINLDRRKDALVWVIDDNNDFDAVFITPFKHEAFTQHLSNNPPPYSNLPTERFSYDPTTGKIYLNSVGSRYFQSCFLLKKESADAIRQ